MLHQLKLLKAQIKDQKSQSQVSKGSEILVVTGESNVPSESGNGAKAEGELSVTSSSGN